MRPKTIYKKIDNDHVEKKDELTGVIKTITVDELTDELEQYLHNFYSENYKKLIGDFDESQNKLSMLFYNYSLIIDNLIKDHDEEIYFLESGFISHDITITTEEGENITFPCDSPHEVVLKYKDDISRVLIKELFNKKEKADITFLEITNKIDKGENIDFAEMMKKINVLLKGPRPKYITGLIDEGYLMPDGRTALVGLERIAEYLYTHIENVTPEILLQFRQKNGLPFTQRTAQAAATGCKSK